MIKDDSLYRNYLFKILFINSYVLYYKIFMLNTIYMSDFIYDDEIVNIIHIAILLKAMIEKNLMKLEAQKAEPVSLTWYEQ